MSALPPPTPRGLWTPACSAESSLLHESHERSCGPCALRYEFYIPSAKIEVAGNALRLTCDIENRGVAPFYYTWPVECGLAREGEILAQWQTELDITGLLPGEVLELRTSVNIDQLPAGTSQLMLRIANPLEGALPVRFANTTQDADIVGWLTLGSVEIP